MLNTMLMAEESIVKLLNHAATGTEIFVDCKKILDQIQVKITVSGEPFDFFAENEFQGLLGSGELDEAEEATIQQIVIKAFSDRIRYRNKYHKNVVQIIAKKTELGQLYRTLGAVILALFCGILMKFFLPEAVMFGINTYLLKAVKTLFLNALKTLIGPVVFFSLVSCIAGFSDFREFGKIGGKIIAFYMLTTLIATLIGTGFGLSMKSAASGSLLQSVSDTVQVASDTQISVFDTLMGIVPSNIVKPFVETDMLQIIFLAVLLGVGTSLTAEYSDKLRSFFDAGNALFLNVTTLIIKIIPVVVFCSITSLVITTGLDTMVSILQFLLTVLAAFVMMIAAYSLLLVLFTRLNVVIYLKKIWSIMLAGLSLSSSNAVMPIAMNVCTEKYGISRKITSFAIPLGATINMDGSCIYLTVAAIFLANIYGVPITGSRLLAMIFSVIVLSIGAPAIPGSAFVCLSVLLVQIQVPVEAVSIIMAIDPIMSMLRTATNVCGDVTGALIVAKRENLLDLDVYRK